MNDLWHRWLHTVDQDPDKPVLLDSGAGEWKSAREIHEQAEALANEWESVATKGRITVFCLPNGSEWLRVFLALQRLGSVAVAMDPSTPGKLVVEQAKQLGASFIHDGAQLAPTGQGSEWQAALCLGKMTSGSTGMPKALLFRRAEMIADGENIIRTMGIRPSDVNFAMIPFGHSYGLGNLVMPLILQGTAIACGSDPLPRIAAGDMERTGATVLPSVPAFYRALANTDLKEEPLPKLRLFISAGSPLSREVAQQFEARFGRRIHNFYGSSETGGIAYDRDGSLALRGEGVGQQLEGVTLGTDDDGEIVVRSGAVFTIGNPHVREGLGEWRTGDLGSITEAGALRIEGRRRPLAKIGGRRVDPLEVERMLRELPGVGEAIVQVQTHASGDRLQAFVESELGQEAVREALAHQLPTWKIPRRIVVMATLPRDGRGKVSQAALERISGNA